MTTKMNLPKRKNYRLKNFDYSSVGAYFITICTKNRENLFWNDVGASIARPQEICLSKYGKIVDEAIANISKTYAAVSVEKYVIMPNHIHLIVQIHGDENGRAMPAPTVSNIVSQMKGYVSKQIGFPIWQKLFYDHIIRNEDDFREICEYINNNPARWRYDKFYI